MRRALVLTVLLAFAGCGAPEPPAWDAWLEPGTVRFDWERNTGMTGVPGEPTTVSYEIEIAREPTGHVLRLQLSPNERERIATSKGADALEFVAALNSRELHVPDADTSRVTVSPYTAAAQRLISERLAAAERLSLMSWPETTAWQEAEIVRCWNAWGVPWLTAAERGEDEASLTLPVVGYDVTIPLALGPVEIHADGTVRSSATYVCTGTDARDLNAVFLRLLRERGDETAAANMEIEVRGTLTVTYDAVARRPIHCRHATTTTRRDASDGFRMETESEQTFTFRWSEDDGTD